MKIQEARIFVKDNLEIIKSSILSLNGGVRSTMLSNFLNDISFCDEHDQSEVTSPLMKINEITNNQFLKIFRELQLVEEIVVNFEKSTKATFYIFFPQEHNVYTVSRLIQPNSYFSNFTALSLHQLIDDKSNIIYMKTEKRTPPMVTKQLSNINQKKLDIAFSKPSRKTSNIATFTWNKNKYKVCLLEGYKLQENLDSFSFIEQSHPSLAPIKYSNIERTLIECTINPSYSGGVESILKAFEEAKEILNTKKMSSLLNESHYIYPYERRIAFYMSKVLMLDQVIENFLEKIENKNNDNIFYLDNQIVPKKIDEKFRIYYPISLEDNN